MNIQKYKLFLAFYRADSETSTFLDKTISFIDGSKFSHVEIAVELNNGLYECYSSSGRDGGVRKKNINLKDNKWVLYEIPEYLLTYDRIVKIYDQENKCKYDFFGLLSTKIEYIKGSNSKWYCSEYCAYNLGLKDFNNMGVKDLNKWADKNLYKL